MLLEQPRWRCGCCAGDRRCDAACDEPDSATRDEGEVVRAGRGATSASLTALSMRSVGSSRSVSYGMSDEACDGGITNELMSAKRASMRCSFYRADALMQRKSVRTRVRRCKRRTERVA